MIVEPSVLLLSVGELTNFHIYFAVSLLSFQYCEIWKCHAVTFVAVRSRSCEIEMMQLLGITLRLVVELGYLHVRRNWVWVGLCSF